MTPEALDSALCCEPFVPLRLHLSSGSTRLIANPDLCFINHGALYIARIDRPNSRLADDLDVVSLRHVVSIEQAPEPGRSNGRSNGA